jgi:hypothetical protein
MRSIWAITDPRHYVVVRSDLPVGVIAAMIVHAAGESGKGVDTPPRTHAVVLQVPNATALVLLQNKVAAAGVPHVVITEPDEPYNGDPMAIGFPIEAGAFCKANLSHIPLLKYNPEMKK